MAIDLSEWVKDEYENHRHYYEGTDDYSDLACGSYVRPFKPRAVSELLLPSADVVLLHAGCPCVLSYGIPRWRHHSAVENKEGVSLIDELGHSVCLHHTTGGGC